MTVTNEQVDAVYDEFIGRYQEQFLAADQDFVLVGGWCGEPEQTFSEAIWNAPHAGIQIADDMIQKILSVLPPETDLGWSVRTWLQKYRPDFVEQPLAS